MTDHLLLAVRDAFADPADPRVDRAEAHLLLDSVAIAICGVMCGADSWVAIEEFGVTKRAWLQTFLAWPKSPRTIPLGASLLPWTPPNSNRAFCTGYVPAGRRQRMK